MADEVELDESALDAGRLAQLAEREKRVEAALRAGKTTDATLAALENPCFASKDAAMKDRSSNCVIKAIVALGQKDADVVAVLEKLNPDQADILMKARAREAFPLECERERENPALPACKLQYLYKGLAKPDNSGLLLKVHALLVEKSGLGAMLRVVEGAHVNVVVFAGIQ